MTKQLEDLFTSFSGMTGEEQLAKIREVRHNRNIVRPAVAVKRAKKAEKFLNSNSFGFKMIIPPLFRLIELTFKVNNM